MTPTSASTEKRFLDGTHRLVAPEVTLERMRRFMPVMGITRIANITGLDRIGIPVVGVIRPNSRSVAVAQGKGITDVAAEASGLMEAIETYHAERIELPLKIASYNEMKRWHKVINTSKLPKIPDSKFDENCRLYWIEGQDLISSERTWVPYELVHTDYRFPAPEGSGCFLASSNGLASGNHLLEAISHAICEVVERDATALMRVRGEEDMLARRMNLDSVQEHGLRELVGKFERAGIDAAVWDATSDIGIPTCSCWLRERDGVRRTLGRATIGAGCHPARQIALSRALTEAAQERLTLISGSRDSLSRGDYYEDLDEAVVAAQARVFSTPGGRQLSAVATHDFMTFEEEVAWQLERLQAVGVDEVVAVDLTKVGVFDVPVVRVIIPGLEGYEDGPEGVPGERALRLAETNQ